MNCRRSPLLFAFALALTGRSAAAEEAMPAWMSGLHFSAATTVAWTENISRTSFEPTRKDAATYAFSLNASRPQQLARNWLLSAGADADYLSVPDFSRNDSVSGGPRLGVQYKFGLGPLAPVLRLDTAYHYKSSRIAANRGGTAEAGLHLAKRLTESFRLALNGEWLEHYARSATFDIQQRTVSVDASWDIDEHWRLSGSAGRLTGRIVANAAPQVWAQAISGGLGATVFNYYTTIPWEVTDSYGAGWTSYNVEAHADLWSAALGYSLSDRTNLELRTSSVFVVNRIGIRYPSESWGLSLIHRF